MRTIEQLTADLRRAGVNPSGYGERVNETREEHVERINSYAELCTIVREDVLYTWPMIEAGAR